MTKRHARIIAVIVVLLIMTISVTSVDSYLVENGAEDNDWLYPKWSHTREPVTTRSDNLLSTLPTPGLTTPLDDEHYCGPSGCWSTVYPTGTPPSLPLLTPTPTYTPWTMVSLTPTPTSDSYPPPPLPPPRPTTRPSSYPPPPPATQVSSPIPTILPATPTPTLTPVLPSTSKEAIDLVMYLRQAIAERDTE